MKGAARLRLGVNIDHVATVRNARGSSYPDPVRAAQLAIDSGADGVTAHLREDRRHISDNDIAALTRFLNSAGRPLNLEIAATREMETIALAHRPQAACIVPERREEVTTEGGLDVAGMAAQLAPTVRRLSEAGVRVSMFVEADPLQIEAARDIGAAVVELHTGVFCDAWREGRETGALLDRLKRAAVLADQLGLEVHAGHGIDYETVAPIAAIPEVRELNIGHFLVGEAIFVGLAQAIAKMRMQMDRARSEALA